MVDWKNSVGVCVRIRLRAPWRIVLLPIILWLRLCNPFLTWLQHNFHSIIDQNGLKPELPLVLMLRSCRAQQSIPFSSQVSDIYSIHTIIIKRSNLNERLTSNSWKWNLLVKPPQVRMGTSFVSEANGWNSCPGNTCTSGIRNQNDD